MAKAGDRPFAVFVTFHAPHEQVEPPEAYTSMYAELSDPTVRALLRHRLTRRP